MHWMVCVCECDVSGITLMFRQCSTRRLASNTYAMNEWPERRWWITAVVNDGEFVLQFNHFIRCSWINLKLNATSEARTRRTARERASSEWANITSFHGTTESNKQFISIIDCIVAHVYLLACTWDVWNLKWMSLGIVLGFLQFDPNLDWGEVQGYLNTTLKFMRNMTSSSYLTDPHEIRKGFNGQWSYNLTTETDRSSSNGAKSIRLYFNQCAHLEHCAEKMRPPQQKWLLGVRLVGRITYATHDENSSLRFLEK